MNITKLLKKGIYPRSYRQKTTPASINPAIAYAMNQIAELEDNDKILDPCCGTATLLIERLLQKPAICFGVDIDPRQLENAKENITAANLIWQDSGQARLARRLRGSLLATGALTKRAGMTENKISLLHGNITEKKFPEGYFTKIISNLPYGIHSGSREKNVKLYHFLADTSSTWLKKGGKAIFLTSSKNLLRNSFEFNKKMKLLKELEIPKDSLKRSIFIFEKI